MTKAERIAFEQHRTARQEAQRAKILSQQHIRPDSILEHHGEGDARVGVTIVLRPPSEMRRWIIEVQGLIKEALGETQDALWYAPEDLLHMTVLEWLVAATGQQDTVETIIGHLSKPEALNILTELPSDPPIRLDRATLSYDESALALSFLPLLTSPKATSYPVFRRSLRNYAEELVRETGVMAPKGRYDYPSAHITIARFKQAVPSEQIDALVHGIDTVATRLQVAQTDASWTLDGPLHIMSGRIWYGGGERLRP